MMRRERNRRVLQLSRRCVERSRMGDRMIHNRAPYWRFVATSCPYKDRRFQTASNRLVLSRLQPIGPTRTLTHTAASAKRLYFASFRTPISVAASLLSASSVK